MHAADIASAWEPNAEVVLKGYLEHTGCKSIESFNHYITKLLPSIVEENSELRHTHVQGGEKHVHVISFGKPCVVAPVARNSDGFYEAVYPNDARIRMLTYESPVRLNVTHSEFIEEEDGTLTPLQQRTHHDSTLFYQPIMVGSVCCHTRRRPGDYGQDRDCEEGMFIINGIEKCMIAQEKLRNNHFFVFPGRTPRCSIEGEIRACNEKKLRSTSTLYLHVQEPKGGGVPDILCTLPFVQMKVPIGWLFVLLGAGSKEDMEDVVLGDGSGCSAALQDLARSVLDHTATDMSADDVYAAVGKRGTTEATVEKQKRYLTHIVKSEFLPHEGMDMTDDTLRRKALALGHMVLEMLKTVLGERSVDSRDHCANKRVDGPGWLMSLMVRQIFRMFLRALSAQLHRAITKQKALQLNEFKFTITPRLRQAFATNNWGASKGGVMQTGVVQACVGFNTAARVSALSATARPISSESKALPPRRVNPSQYGLTCPVETPEGTSCGLRNVFAITASVRLGQPSSVVKNFVHTLRGDDGAPLVKELLECTSKDRGAGTAVLLNGMLLGFAASAERTELAIRNGRRAGLLPRDVSVALFAKQRRLLVTCDSGAMVRPLFRADMRQTAHDLIEQFHQQPAVLWGRLACAGAIEYLTKEEEGTMRVAMRWRDVGTVTDEPYTHVEVAPFAMMGHMAALIPFSHFNQSPRNTYQSAMGKQSISRRPNGHTRMDGVQYMLRAPQTPIVATAWDRITRNVESPAGANAIVAILCGGGASGDNQEDACIFNLRSRQRGMYDACVRHAVKSDLRPSDTTQRHGMPSAGALMRVGDYSHLDPATGIVRPGAVVKAGDVIIGKENTVEDPVRNTTQKRDMSVQVKGNGNSDETHTVQQVVHTKNRHGEPLVWVSTDTTRPVGVGDKFTSRHGQKGVVGAMRAAVDMPFIANGMTPDIIINPHAIPSRMTIGHLMESLLSLLSVREGKHGDGTPFAHKGDLVGQIGDALEQHGFERHGNAKMYNGRTGEPLEYKVFLAPCFYQRLKHMPQDKWYARSVGPDNVTTRQPLEGRARNGGLRVGEMEADCLKAHGAAHILQDRLCFSSDCTSVPVCSTCGMIAEPHRPRSAAHHVRARDMYCRKCESSAGVRNVNMPYAMLLFIREMMTASIMPVLQLTNDGTSASDKTTRKWTVSRFRHAAKHSEPAQTDVLEYHPAAHAPDNSASVALHGVQSVQEDSHSVSLSAAFANATDGSSSGEPCPVSCTTPPRRPRSLAATTGGARDQAIADLLESTGHKREAALHSAVRMMNTEGATS